MISTAKRLFKCDGYNVGMASVFNESGKAFLQVALLFGKDKPIATMSHLIPVPSTRDAEERLKNMEQEDIPPLIAQLQQEMPIVKQLANALNNAKANPTVYHQPAQELQVKKSYKRTIR